MIKVEKHIPKPAPATYTIELSEDDLLTLRHFVGGGSRLAVGAYKDAHGSFNINVEQTFSLTKRLWTEIARVL